MPVTAFEEDLQAAIIEAKGNLSLIDNGYTWVVGFVMDQIFPVLEKHVEGFTPDNINFEDGE